MDTAALTVIDSLADLSPITAGSLGHVTALSSPDVRVVVLSFGAGYVLKEHSAPKTLLMQALGGRLIIATDGQEITLIPGGLLRLDAGLRHEVTALEDSRLMLTLIG